ncbi:MAG: hypothetical protein H7Y03_05510 [Chitinophagaceae bacterium]|nr:hypothetical protein [Chitinophagaceae bacterium]
MKGGLKAIIIPIVVLVGCVEQRLQPFSIGDTMIYIATVKKRPVPKGIYLIHLHENEQSALEAGRHYLRKRGGMLLTLKHTSMRNIRFAAKGTNYEFDPNRIFSESGIKASLANLSSDDPVAIKAIKMLADTIISNMQNPILVIALHNNTRGEPLNIDSYTVENSAFVYVNPVMGKDDFVLTTDKNIFLFLKERKINAVLQQARNTQEDGSLSVYYSNKNVPYMNIETEQGNISEQKRILKEIEPLIRAFITKKPR